MLRTIFVAASHLNELGGGIGLEQQFLGDELVDAAVVVVQRFGREVLAVLLRQLHLDHLEFLRHLKTCVSHETGAGDDRLDNSPPYSLRLETALVGVSDGLTWGGGGSFVACHTRGYVTVYHASVSRRTGRQYYTTVYLFRAAEPLSTLNPSNFVPKNGFPVVKDLQHVVAQYVFSMLHMHKKTFCPLYSRRGGETHEGTNGYLVYMCFPSLTFIFSFIGLLSICEFRETKSQPDIGFRKQVCLAKLIPGTCSGAVATAVVRRGEGGGG